MQTALHSHSSIDALDQPPTAEDRRRLRRFPLLAEAGDVTVQSLLAQTPITVVPRHEAVVREGVAPTGLIAVITGRVALLTQMPGEQPVVVAMVGRGEFLMPSAAIAGAAYPLTARAVEETRIASIPLAAIHGAAEQDRTFSGDLAKLASTEWRTLLEQFKDYRLRSAPQRFASYLAQAAQASGRVQDNAAELELPDDRKTLASLLGMTPENLSRTIAQFRERGVAINGRLVSIADLRGLAEFAGLPAQ